jgi:trehalose transport system substrate-binding protein
MVDEHKPVVDDIKEKRPWAWIIAIAIVAIVAFSAGYFPFHSTTSSNTVHVQFYESLAPSEASYMNNTLIPMFEQQYPGIKVTLVNVGSGQVSTDVLAMEQSGNIGPVVAGQDNLEIGQLIYSSSGNVLMNLTNSSSAVLPSHLTPAGQNLTNYEKSVFGGTYFFPFRGNVPLVFYNKTSFSKSGITTPPANYSQLLNDAKKLANNNSGVGQIMIQGGSTNGVRGGSSTATEMYQMMVQFGGNPLYLNDSGDIQAMQYLYNLSPYLNSGYHSGYWGTYSGLATGKYSMVDYQWPYIYNNLIKAPYNMSPKTLGFYPGPSGPNKSSGSNHLLGGDVLFIPKGATNVPSLEAFMHFLLSANVQKDTLLNLSWVAINSAAYQNLPAAYSAIDGALGNATASGLFLRNPTPWITEWQTIFCNDVFNKLFPVSGTTTGYASIPSLMWAAHNATYTYILNNYGSANATLYQSPSAYAPITV